VIRRLVLGLLVTWSLAPRPVAADPARPAILRDVTFTQRLGEAVPLDLPFRDEAGAPVTLRDYFGSKPVLLVPAYYECPMLCTLVLNGVVSALRTLPFDVGNQFTVVTFSFNPADSPALAAAKKATYLGEYRRPGAAAGWHFLTGDEPAIRRLSEAIGFHYAYDPAQKQYAHAAGIVVLTPDGHLARYFFGVEFSPRDLRLALVEAADRRIGTMVDALLLFCFHYDPAMGRYSAIALNAVRLAGLATLLALASFVVLMLRREALRPRG
jgi:protein SCO1/2